ncbi:MAG TPA: carboxypeptidase-like regulatory domain-containing protein, partial [Blastocatellia bacterium]
MRADRRRYKHTGATSRGAVFVVCVLLAGAPLSLFGRYTAFAQVPAATLSGSVEDQAGGAIPGAEVSVRGVDSGLQRTMTSDEQGYFLFALLSPGNYVVSVQTAGFAPVTINDVKLHMSANMVLRIVLKPKPMNESINVIGTSTVSA